MKKWVIVLIIFLISVPLVLAEPPKVQLVVKPTEGEAPLTVLATEQSGDLTIFSWSYDFGNGDKPLDKPEAEYTYEKPGEYTVSLEVQNEKGEVAKDSVLVTVKEPVPITIEPTPTIEPKPDENTTIKTVWEGATPIAAAFTAAAQQKSKTELIPYEKSVILATTTDGTLKAEKYPLDISPDKTTVIKIEKYRCTAEMCGYWISATRDGKEVATNSPVWISPPPYEVLVSESFDSAKNEQTVTLKEDPKEALMQVLQQYVDRQPVGKAVVGTKE